MLLARARLRRGSRKHGIQRYTRVSTLGSLAQYHSLVSWHHCSSSSIRAIEPDLYGSLVCERCLGLDI